MTTIKPRHNNLVVRRYERPEESEGGILIPDAFRTDMGGLLWEVVEVGPGKLTRKHVLVPCECKAGDIVQTDQRWATQALDSVEEGLYLLNEDSVSHIVWRASHVQD